MIIKNVPVVLQMENAECGAASLAMIMRYYGHYGVPLEQLRLDCLVSRDGVTARGIKAAAEKYGLKCRVVKTDINGLKTLPTPVIIHWEMRHFVVLKGFFGNSFYINDPALGRVKVGYDEFNKGYTGIAIILEKTDAFKPENRRSHSFTEKTIMHFLPMLLIISVLGMFTTVFSTILPYFNSIYMDSALTGDMRAAGVLFLVFFLTILLRFFTMRLAERITYDAEKGLNIELSTGFMEKMMKLPVTFFMQRTPGELVNRQLSGFETAETICESVAPVLCQILMIVIYGVLVFKYNIYIALVGAVAVLLNVLVSLLTSEKMSNNASVHKMNNAIYQSSVAAVIDMMDTIKSCACENTVLERLMGAAAMSMQPKMQREKIRLLSSAALEFINYFVTAVVLIAGVGEILQGRLSIGLTVGLMGALSAFLMPVGAFIRSIASVYDLKNSAERFDDTMNYREENIFLTDAEKSKDFDGNITAKDVCFSYDGSDKYALKDISFKLEKGRSLAITGTSGSGKSTLIKLIAGLYAETDGNIYYGQAEKKDITRQDFYSKLAIVCQSVQMYEGTVLENITMWRDTPYEEVVKACKTACIHDEIVLRKGAYYEKVTEGGTNFSGGQRQRFEIARALLRKPEILILDEATSALDTITEKHITDNIMALGITLIVIAHRLSTIKNCDEILVLKDGKIAEKGTHESLLKQGGVYAQLVKEG